MQPSAMHRAPNVPERSRVSCDVRLLVSEEMDRNRCLWDQGRDGRCRSGSSRSEVSPLASSAYAVSHICRKITLRHCTCVFTVQRSTGAGSLESDFALAQPEG